MSKIHVFKTDDGKQLVIVDEDQPNKVFNAKIPPSALEEVYSFESASIKQYAEALIPLLFQELKEDKSISKLFKLYFEDNDGKARTSS